MRAPFLVVLIAAAVLAVAAPASALLSPVDRISPEGLGAVKVGMTIDEAAAAAGTSLRVNRIPGGGIRGCFTARPAGTRALYFLGTGDRIARATIFRTSRIRTPEGAGIGTTERRVRALYPGRVRSSRHVYIRGGRYLTVGGFAPGRFVVFETSARGRVVAVNAGAAPEVGYVEGCL